MKIVQIEAGKDIQKFINVIEKLNHKYDEYEMFHHTTESYPFKFKYECTSNNETYEITFMNEQVYYWDSSDYIESDIDDEEMNEDSIINNCEQFAKRYYELIKYAINDFHPTEH